MHHGKGLLKPFAQGTRRARMRGFQVARKILQHIFGD